MPVTDPRIDAYIAGKPDFARPILTHLRARIHAAVPEVEETIRWNMPSFSLAGRPLANMAAFQRHVAFDLWRRDAMRPAAERAASDGMGDFGKLTSVGDLPGDAELDAAIRQAAAIARAPAAARPTRERKPEAAVPDALAAALADDAAANATFRAFPPSCRREYCEWIAAAKRPETRARRVARTVELLRAGKRHNEMNATA